ncbi:MAG: tandem-95 repeat protein, partial [Deltaproteobacteria bacterium]|nr:tandem-95 repeat protein [Deltaproteobacteria bacterium]
MRPTRWISYITSFLLLALLGGAAHAVERRLLIGSEARVTTNELLTLLGILPGSNTNVKVSTSPTSGFGSSAQMTADGALTCRADGTEVVLAAPHGPASTGSCYAKVCTTTLALITLCDTAKLDVRSVSCLESGPTSVDPGCNAEAPVCTGGNDAHCVGCQRDSDCGSSSGAFGLGLGQVTTVTANLLHGLLGLDILVPLSTLKVSAAVNGPFSNEAVLGADATCSVGADGSVSLAAGNVAGESTCYVQACVPLLGTCLVVPLDLIVDGCLLGQACDPIAACDTTTNTCISCRDDHAAGDIDRGCSTGTPTCHGAGSQASCVECEVDADCTGSTLDVALGPNRSLTVELARILDVLRQSTSLVPSSVKVGASLDGPFSNQTAFAADAALTGCAVDQSGNVVLTAAAISGHVTCNVQVCATLLGNTLQTCLVVPIDATVDVCVLDNSCDLAPTCQADFTCGGCKDTKPPGGVDRGCSNDTPACGEGTCNECLADADCNIKTPLLDLDLGGVGEVLFSDILASLHLPVLASIESVKVAANVTGPFSNDTLLDVQGDVAHCTVDLDNNVELVASTTVYGYATCNVEVCVTLLSGNVHTCYVVPIALNVDPCASRGDCRPPLCDGSSNTCETCIDTGPGTDRGCSDDLPACITDLTGDRHCEECDTDADCGSGEYCGDDHTCKTCEDDTSGGVDTGCTETTRACDTEPLAGGDPICVECTEDADCPSTVCDEPTRTCKPCEDSAAGNAVDNGCDPELPICDTSATASGGVERCVECTEDAHCAPNELCLLSEKICVPRDSVLARDDQYATAFATALSVTAAQGVLANDRAPEGAALTATLVAETIPDPSSTGTLTLAADGSFTFAPVPGFAGPVSFQYEAQAATGLPARATAVIEVGANRPPVASDEWVTTPQETPILIVVLANDVDPDNHPLGVPSASDPLYGDLEILDDATVLYTPPSGFIGRDAFTYQACDPYGGCTEGSVLVTVTPVNHAPMAADDHLFLVPNSSGVVVVLAHDGDADGDLLVIGDISADDFTGTIDRVDGGLLVTPLKDALGTFTFAYDACDPSALCDRAVVLVEVGETPPDPIVAAVDDSAETIRNLEVEIDVLANDTLVGDGTLWIGSWNRGAHGAVTMTIENTLVYRPDAGFVGEDAFRYTACDGHGHCDSATVTVTVLRGDNTPPIALDDLVSTKADTAVVLSPVDNDFDPDNDVLSVHSVGVAGHGIAVLLGDGTVEYTPNAG